MPLIIIFFAAGVANGAGGDFVWEYEADYSTIMTPAVLDGKVYMPVGIKFMCIDAASGSALWEHDLQAFTWASPAVSGGKVFFGGMNNATLYCLDAASGEEIWRYKDPSNSGSWSSPPVIWGDYVYGGSPAKKKLYCLSAMDGSLIWEFENNLASNPVVSGGYVYTAGYNQDGKYVYYCLNAKTGSLVWESEEISPIGYRPSVAGSYLFVGGYKLTCLNALTGEMLWKTDVGALESAPAVSGDRVYISARKKTYCFKANNGEKIWEYDSESTVGYSQPVVTGNFVYLGARVPNKLICLNAGTGELVFEHEANDYVHTPSIYNGYVYFGIGNNGTSAISGVFCVKAADGDTGSWPMFGYNPERTSALNYVTSPTQAKPTTPTLSSPANGSSGVSLMPTLTTNAFYDPDTGDTHLQTDWQISTSDGFSTSILNSESPVHLISLPVPDLVLLGSTTYYWRARFYDNNSNISEWSEAFSFTTLQKQNDTNENGIPDTLENNTIDLDEDGTADIEQTDVIKTLNTVVGYGQMGISIKESTTVTQTVEINSIDPDDISRYLRPHTMPLGMLSFKLNVTNPGDTAHVKIHFSEAAPEDASWFFHDSINGWIDYSQYATFSDDRKSASVQLKDGGHGDSDGVANGVIVDPCGFGIASWLKGKVSDSATSEGLTKTIVSISDLGLTLNTMLDGNFLSMILPGTYDIDVSASGYQAEAFFDIEVAEDDIVTQDVELTGRCKISGLEITGTPSESTPVKLKVNAQSGSKTINYRYSMHHGYGTSSYDGSHWLGMTPSEYQTENSCDYTFNTSGKSIVVAWATSSAADGVNPNGVPIIGWSVDNSDAECKTHFTGVTITGEQKVNEKITFAVSAENSCGNPNYYRFSMHPYYGTDDYDGTHWENMTSSEWISSNSAELTFTEAGKYIVVVWVSDDTNNVTPEGIPIIGWSVDIE